MVKRPKGFFRDLCENAQDLIQSIDADGRFLYVNRAWHETLGYSKHEVGELNVFDIIHPDSHDHCRQALSELATGTAMAHVVADFVSKDGRRIPVQGSVSCKIEGGQMVATRGIFRDMSEQKRAEEDLDRLFNLSPDMLCIAGVDAYFKRINPAFERALGYSEKELLSRQFVEFVHPDDRENTLAEVDRLAQGLPTVDFENRYLAKDGEYRWLAWRAMPVEDLGMIYAVARDITNQKAVQEIVKRQAEELARSNTELEQFAYVASHDLRAPLRAIANLSEWIEEDHEGEIPPGVSEYLEKVRQQVTRMEKLTDDLLEYSRATRREETIVSVDTGQLVEEVVSLLAPPEGMTVSIAPDMPKLDTSRAALAQVFRNLIGNAILHHDRSTGNIAVSVAEGPDHYEFHVADDGPGIPAADQERIFGMFQRLGATAGADSTGVGLALVKKLVDYHGGRVWVQSRGGRGTTFRFTWPKRIDAPADSLPRDDAG